jgi:hypothetical protein
MEMSDDGSVANYTMLIREFIEARITAKDFERRYLDVFKADNSSRPGRQFMILDRLFADVDAFVGDAQVVDRRFEIDEVELRARAASALKELEGLDD